MASDTFPSQDCQCKSSNPDPALPAPPPPGWGGMTWPAACGESASGMAIRRDKNGLAMLRSWQGNGLVETASGTVRLAYPNELEGHQDWQPVGG